MERRLNHCGYCGGWVTPGYARLHRCPPNYVVEIHLGATDKDLAEQVGDAILQVMEEHAPAIGAVVVVRSDNGA